MASSFVNQDEGGFADPLATSSAGFGDVDPWSENQTPARMASPSANPPLGSIAASTNGSANVEHPALQALLGEFPSSLTVFPAVLG